MGFNENNEIVESIDRFLVLPQEDFLVHVLFFAIGGP
jgi:hypothetical protein